MSEYENQIFIDITHSQPSTDQPLINGIRINDSPQANPAKDRENSIEQPFILGEIAAPRNQPNNNIANPDPAKTKDPTVTPIEPKSQVSPTNEDPLKRESIEK